MTDSRIPRRVLLGPGPSHVDDVASRSAAGGVYPCTYVSEAGCNTPSAPASEAAATNSGLEHGYMGPQISGTSTPACRVRSVASEARVLKCSSDPAARSRLA